MEVIQRNSREFKGIQGNLKKQANGGNSREYKGIQRNLRELKINRLMEVIKGNSRELKGIKGN